MENNLLNNISTMVNTVSPSVNDLNSFLEENINENQFFNNASIIKKVKKLLFKHIIKADTSIALIEFNSITAKLIWEAMPNHINKGYVGGSFKLQCIEAFYPYNTPEAFGVYKV